MPKGQEQWEKRWFQGIPLNSHKYMLTPSRVSCMGQNKAESPVYREGAGLDTH